MLLRERARSADETVEVVLKFAVNIRTRLVKINRAILAFFIGAGSGASDIFCERSFYRPDERMNRAEDENGSFFVPAGVAQRFAAVGIWMRLERPGCIGAKLGGDAEFAQHGLRFDVARDHQ